MKTAKTLGDINGQLNEALFAAQDVARTLDLLSTLYGDLAVRTPQGEQESNLAATFSTIHARAAKVTTLLEDCLG